MDTGTLRRIGARVRVGVLARHLTRPGRGLPVGPGGPTAPAPVLRDAREERALNRLAGWSRLADGDAEACRAALAEAGSEPARSAVLGAIAAGHPAEVVTAFAAALRGLDPGVVRERTVLVDPAVPGPVTCRGVPLAQTDETTCGTTAALVALALADPVLAHRWTAGEPAEVAARWRTLQVRLHGRTNPVWPRRLGTTPWGVRAALSEPDGPIGARYAVRWLDDTDAGQWAGTLAAASAGLASGFPVPLLVGDLYPAHYLLLAGAADAGELAVYNPSGGVLAAVPTAELAAGDLRRATRYPHVHAMLIPVPVEAPGSTSDPEITPDSDEEDGTRR